MPSSTRPGTEYSGWLWKIAAIGASPPSRLRRARHSARAAHAPANISASGSSGRNPARATSSPLTRRQLEILRLVAQGLGNRDIAARLFLSEFTVRHHLANIYMRLGVSSRSAAVARAMRDELV